MLFICNFILCFFYCSIHFSPLILRHEIEEFYYSCAFSWTYCFPHFYIVVVCPCVYLFYYVMNRMKTVFKFYNNILCCSYMWKLRKRIWNICVIFFINLCVMNQSYKKAIFSVCLLFPLFFIIVSFYYKNRSNSCLN